MPRAFKHSVAAVWKGPILHLCPTYINPLETVGLVTVTNRVATSTVIGILLIPLSALALPIAGDLLCQTGSDLAL